MGDSGYATGECMVAHRQSGVEPAIGSVNDGEDSFTTTGIDRYMEVLVVGRTWLGRLAEVLELASRKKEGRERGGRSLVVRWQNRRERFARLTKRYDCGELSAAGRSNGEDRQLGR
jgi:hypothetical protein